MQHFAPEQQPAVHPSVPYKHTEDIQLRQSNISKMGQRLPTYVEEYALFTIVPGDIITMNMRISGRTKIYSKAALSDPDTIYFHCHT